MYFLTELERQQHPVAALIPHDMWKNTDLFNQVLWPEVDACIRYFQETAQLKLQPSYSLAVRKNILTILFCNKPQILVEQLVQYTQQLSITAHDLMELATLTQRFDFLNHFFAITMLSPSYTFSTYRQPCYDLFLAVCKAGQLVTLNQLLGWMPELEKQLMISNHHEKAFNQAVKYGHYEVMLHLLDASSMSINQCLHIDNWIYKYDLIASLTSYGQIAILDHLLTKEPVRTIECIKLRHSQLLNIAVKFGQIDTIHYLLQLLHPNSTLTIETILPESNLLLYANNTQHAIFNFLLKKMPTEAIKAIIAKSDVSRVCNIINSCDIDLLQNLA